MNVRGGLAEKEELCVPLQAQIGQTGQMEINRRNFLCGALLTALGTSVASIESATAATGVKKLANGTVEVTPSAVKSLAKVGGIALIGDVNNVPAALVRSGAKKYLALDLRCTHAGVTVKPEGSGLHCSPQSGGHGSRFTSVGAVTHGPADAPLNKLKVTVKGNKIIVG